MKKMRTEKITTPNQNRLLKVDDIAEMLSISPRTVRSWCYRKIIPTIKLHGALRFDRAEIEKFIKGGAQAYVHQA